MGKPKITLYVDTVSPFAYIGYHILRVSVRLPCMVVLDLVASHRTYTFRMIQLSKPAILPMFQYSWVV